MFITKLYSSNIPFHQLPFLFYKYCSILACMPEYTCGMHVLGCNLFLFPNKSFQVTKHLVDTIFQSTFPICQGNSVGPNDMRYTIKIRQHFYIECEKKWCFWEANLVRIENQYSLPSIPAQWFLNISAPPKYHLTQHHELVEMQ